MIGLFMAFSTAMPWAFMATSMLPMAMPIRAPPKEKVSRVGASTGARKATQKNKPVRVIMRALP